MARKIQKKAKLWHLSKKAKNTASFKSHGRIIVLHSWNLE